MTESTPRITIRQLGADDIDDTAAMLAESSEFHQPWVTYPTSPNQVAGFVTDASANGMLVFGVRHQADNALVGIMTLVRIAGEPWRTAECGCAVSVRYRGNGYLTEGLALLVRYAIDELDLHRIEALVRQENTKSARMLTAVGFRAEGIARGAIRISDVWVDHMRWAITAEDAAGTGIDAH